MATYTNDVPSILDISTRYTSDGKPLKIAEILTKRKPVFQDIPWVESNTTNGHRLAVETGLPNAVLRKINGGVAPSNGSVANITEGTAEFASLGQVDKVLAELSGNVNDYRVKKNGRHIEAIGQKFEDQFFNGTALVPEGFVGLKERYSSLNRQVLAMSGGTGSDLTSIWVVGWGMDTVYGIYTKGTQAGIVHEDYGVDLVDDGAGGKYPAYRDWFKLHAGVAIEDYRAICRIANIDVSGLVEAPTPGTNPILANLLIKATHRIKDAGESLRPVIYCNRDVYEWLDVQAANRTILALKHEELDGQPRTTFRGIPIRVTDALQWNESQVS